MGGTKEGGQAAARTNIIQYGEDFYSLIGKKGGRAGKGHKFAHGKITAQEAGKLGGKVSKRRAR